MLKKHTLEHIGRLPVQIETQSDDGAYEEAHIDVERETRKASEVFSEGQIAAMMNLLRETDLLEGFLVQDYTYFSTAGSKFGRIEVYLELEGGGSRKIFSATDSAGTGSALIVDYKSLDFRLKRDHP